MSTHNICFYEEISKIIPLLSSNTHLISSDDLSSQISRVDFPILINWMKPFLTLEILGGIYKFFQTNI